MPAKTMQHTSNKIDGLDLDHPFSIPKEVKQKIRERGFYLYEWISPQDLKNTIERDFLYILNIIGIPLAVISGLIGFIFYHDIASMFQVFSLFTLGIGAIILLYLFFIGIRRSYLLTKNSYIVLTDSSISVGGKIVTYDKLGQLHDNMLHTAEVFEEDLFEESQLSKTRSGLFADVSKKLFQGYSYILKSNKRGSSRKDPRIILVFLALYTLYAIIMGGIYIFGIFFIWMLGLAIMGFNRFLLLLIGHKVTTINDLFDKILQESIGLKSEKKNLQKLLSQASENDWRDSLLRKINKGIADINDHAADSIDISTELKTTIQTSRYTDMFNFGIYNNWIKDQVLAPISDIRDLLQNSLELLTQNIADLKIQIQNTPEASLSGPLVLQKKRLDAQLGQITQTIKMLDGYIQKLK